MSEIKCTRFLFRLSRATITCRSILLGIGERDRTVHVGKQTVVVFNGHAGNFRAYSRSMASGILLFNSRGPAGIHRWVSGDDSRHGLLPHDSVSRIPSANQTNAVDWSLIGRDLGAKVRRVWLISARLEHARGWTAHLIHTASTGWFGRVVRWKASVSGMCAFALSSDSLHLATLLQSSYHFAICRHPFPEYTTLASPANLDQWSATSLSHTSYIVMLLLSR